MSNIGESSRGVEEEFIDIHMDVEQGVEVEPELDPMEDHEAEAEAETEEVQYHTSPDEVPPEDHLIELLADRNLELEGRVQQLEEENQTHQDREEQYHTLAYQLTDKNTELEDRVRELQEENHDYQNVVGQYESLVHQLVARNAELSAMKQEAEQKRVELQAENEALKAEFDLEIADKIRIEEAWSRSATRVDHLEGEVRAKKARMDAMSYAFFTGFGRWRDRVSRYPAEEGQTHHTISRQLVDYIGRQEYDDAIQRGMLG